MAPRSIPVARVVPDPLDRSVSPRRPADPLPPCEGRPKNDRLTSVDRSKPYPTLIRFISRVDPGTSVSNTTERPSSSAADRTRSRAELFRALIAVRTAHLHLERALFLAPELAELVAVPTSLELDADVTGLIDDAHALLGKAAR